MGTFVVFVLVAAVPLGGAMWAWKALSSHTSKWSESTSARGFDLQFEATGVLDMPFDIFQRVSDRRAWTQISRSGSNDRTFLYKFEVGEDGQKQRRTCSLIEIDIESPHTVVRPHTLHTAPPGPADGVDVVIPSTAFSDVFRVQSADPAFAQRLLNTDITDWLLSPGGRVGTIEFEVRDRWLLVIGPKVASPEALMGFHDWSQQLRSRVRVSPDLNPSSG